MNPLLMSLITSILPAKRVCPKCGRSITVPVSKKKQTVICEDCGAKVPPPGKQNP
jgi:transcription elongation factor Elf1